MDLPDAPPAPSPTPSSSTTPAAQQPKAKCLKCPCGNCVKRNRNCVAFDGALQSKIDEIKRLEASVAKFRKMSQDSDKALKILNSKANPIESKMIAEKKEVEERAESLQRQLYAALTELRTFKDEQENSVNPNTGVQARYEAMLKEAGETMEKERRDHTRETGELREAMNRERAQRVNEVGQWRMALEKERADRVRETGEWRVAVEGERETRAKEAGEWRMEVEKEIDRREKETAEFKRIHANQVREKIREIKQLREIEIPELHDTITILEEGKKRAEESFEQAILKAQGDEKQLKDEIQLLKEALAKEKEALAKEKEALAKEKAAKEAAIQSSEEAAKKSVEESIAIAQKVKDAEKLLKDEIRDLNEALTKEKAAKEVAIQSVEDAVKNSAPLLQQKVSDLSQGLKEAKEINDHLFGQIHEASQATSSTFDLFEYIPASTNYLLELNLQNSRVTEQLTQAAEDTKFPGDLLELVPEAVKRLNELTAEVESLRDTREQLVKKSEQCVELEAEVKKQMAIVVQYQKDDMARIRAKQDYALSIMAGKEKTRLVPSAENPEVCILEQVGKTAWLQKLCRKTFAELEKEAEDKQVAIDLAARFSTLQFSDPKLCYSCTQKIYDLTDKKPKPKAKKPNPPIVRRPFDLAVADAVARHLCAASLASSSLSVSAPMIVYDSPPDSASPPASSSSLPSAPTQAAAPIQDPPAPIEFAGQPITTGWGPRSIWEWMLGFF